MCIPDNYYSGSDTELCTSHAKVYTEEILMKCLNKSNCDAIPNLDYYKACDNVKKYHEVHFTCIEVPTKVNEDEEHNSGIQGSLREEASKAVIEAEGTDYYPDHHAESDDSVDHDDADNANKTRTVGQGTERGVKEDAKAFKEKSKCFFKRLYYYGKIGKSLILMRKNTL